jgi:hypothetical protein
VSRRAVEGRGGCETCYCCTMARVVSVKTRKVGVSAENGGTEKAEVGEAQDEKLDILD